VRKTSSYFLAVSVLITILGAVIRLADLSHDSLWFDEIMTRHTAVQGSGSAAAAMDVRDHLPLLYALVATVLRVLPEHEFTLRLPSAVAGILAVPLLITFGRSTRLPRAGLWSALLLAIAPFHVRYSLEARHYALLLFFSLLSLYWLYRALRHNRQRDWLIFALATAINLMTHYSAWLLLAGEGLLIVLWAVFMTRRRGLAALWPTVPAALILGIVLLALMPRARNALAANSGTEAATGTTAAASLVTWLSEIWLAFGFGVQLPALILSLGAVLGMAYLLYRRRWLVITLFGMTAVVPILLIQFLQVSRWALPKYVIYLLPIYLFSCGVALQVSTEWLAERLPWPRAQVARTAIVALPVAILLIAVAWRPLQQEQNDLVRDWRGAAVELGPANAAGDTVVAMALDTADGYNAAGVAGPYYLDSAYRVLDGNHFSLETAQKLAGQQGRVSALLLNSNQPVEANGSQWRVSPYRHGLFAVTSQDGSSDILAQLTALYELLVPQAEASSSQCDLRQKLAVLYLVDERYGDARDALTSVDPTCPLGVKERERLQTQIDQQLLAAAIESGDEAGVSSIAAFLLARDPGDELALAAVTETNLLDLFLAGEADVVDDLAPEPVGARQFTMPQTADTGEVLFMHPPAVARFTVQMPPEPLTLYTRLALDPESWGWGGDGVTFVVHLGTPNGELQEIYRGHVANDTADQTWHTIEISLADYAGQAVTISLATENGPAGDGTGDWAGWETPRLLRELQDSE